MTMLKQDEQVWKKPKCKSTLCDNDGFVLFGGAIYCGECVMKFEKKKNSFIQEMIQQ